MEEDEQFNQAFGEHTGIVEGCKEWIWNIKNNNDDSTVVHLRSVDADLFTDLAWRLFGRYIANKSNLRKLGLDMCNLTDQKMASLSVELTSSRSLVTLDLDCNMFGVEGLRNVVPFLRNCPQLKTLYLGENENINTDCFELLVSALDGRSVEEMHFFYCNIEDISALGTYNLPNHKTLNLTNNNIGMEGIRILSNKLQQVGSTLKELILTSTRIDDEGTELLATSLKHNTTLEALYLEGMGNNITERGCNAILKLMVDVSSINSTYNSNHTLTVCDLKRDEDDISIYGEIQSLIDEACEENGRSSNPDGIGRAKVIKYQLNSQKRKELCELQGVEYIPGNIFADIEPVLLPRILALIGERHGQSELYTALVRTAPELLSYIDRKALIDREIAKNISQADTLRQQANALMLQASVITAKNDLLSKRREMIDIGDSMQSAGGEGNSIKVGDKKRKVQH